MKKASSSTNIADDLSSIFGGWFMCEYIFKILWNFWVTVLTDAPFVPFFYGLKLLHHHLEHFRKLMGKVKKDEKPGWNASRGLRSVRYAILYFLPRIDFFFIFVKE